MEIGDFVLIGDNSILSEVSSSNIWILSMEDWRTVIIPLLRLFIFRNMGEIETISPNILFIL